MRNKHKSYLTAISFAVVSALLSGCGDAVLNPKGKIATDERDLIFLATGLMLIVVIPVFIMTFLFAWKYRASNEKAKYTPDWAHSNRIEAWVWAIPCIIIVILATVTWKTTHDLDPYKPLDVDAKPLTIQVVALDWKWLFIYPEQNIATVNYVQFPEKVPIDFKITADAPMNSFFIPQLAGQIYAMPGMETQLHAIAETEHTYDGISANYSGGGFSGMRFVAKSTTQEDFDNWVKQVRQSPTKLDSNEYNQLARPSENNPVALYSDVQNDLFHFILMKFMMPSPEMGSGSM